MKVMKNKLKQLQVEMPRNDMQTCAQTERNDEIKQTNATEKNGHLFCYNLMHVCFSY